MQPCKRLWRRPNGIGPKADTSLTIDLESCAGNLMKRLTDFCSGLTCALKGSVQFIGEKVALLAPLVASRRFALADRQWYGPGLRPVRQAVQGPTSSKGGASTAPQRRRCS